MITSTLSPTEIKSTSIMITNNIQELLSIAEPIFLSIDDAIANQDWNRVFELLDSPQPEEWIKKGKSDFFAGEEYEYNEIELLEAVLSRICPAWKVEIMTPIFVQDKGTYAVTSKLSLSLLFKQVGYNNDEYSISYAGVATTYAQSIKHLTLATPKSVTDAVKNACKRIGRLLGRDLNRGIEDVPIIQAEVVSEVDNELEEAKATILKMGSFELASGWLLNSPWKYNQELRNLIKSTYIINDNG